MHFLRGYIMTKTTPNKGKQSQQGADRAVKRCAFALKFKVALILIFSTLSALASEPVQSWHGNTFQEIKSLADIPAAIQRKLGVAESGLGGVADRGQPFNATDVNDSALPKRRLLAAAREGDVWLIALEQGGRGYNVQAYLFLSNGDLRQHWVLPGRPTTLLEVQARIPRDHSGDGG